MQIGFEGWGIFSYIYPNDVDNEVLQQNETMGDFLKMDFGESNWTKTIFIK